jgi:hypothetical protein
VAEVQARLGVQPAALSLEMARLLVAQRDRTHFDSTRARRELGIAFRPLEDTLRDTVAWYQENGWPAEQAAPRAVRERREPDQRMTPSEPLPDLFERVTHADTT